MPVFEKQPQVDGVRVMGYLIVVINPFVVVMHELRLEKIVVFMIVAFDDTSGN
jgi:hypothetical protein